jgi:hypothetical protein
LAAEKARSQSRNAAGPTFYVFQKTDPENHPTLFQIVGGGAVEAATAKAAIAQVAKGNRESMEGEFMAVPVEAVTILQSQPAVTWVTKERP